MGRLKKTVQNGPFDRIGELVNLEKCPDCTAHLDCFACMNGKCTALNLSDGDQCSFYKPLAQIEKEDRETYRKLKESKRYDLIEKYADTFSALGIFDAEIGDSDKAADELAKFEEDDFEVLISQ